MGEAKPPPTVDLKKALLDPALVFAGPEEVLAHEGLTAAQKIDILRRWEYDAADVAVAVEEGMPGEDDGLLRRILLALERLGAIDAGHTGPSKQHGLGD